jgi:hypothetical protein
VFKARTFLRIVEPGSGSDIRANAGLHYHVTQRNGIVPPVPTPDGFAWESVSSTPRSAAALRPISGPLPAIGVRSSTRLLDSYDSLLDTPEDHVREAFAVTVGCS